MSITVAKPNGKNAPGWAAMVHSERKLKSNKKAEVQSSKPRTHASLMDRYSAQLIQPPLTESTSRSNSTVKIARQCMSCGLLYGSYHTCS